MRYTGDFLVIYYCCHSVCLGILNKIKFKGFDRIGKTSMCTPSAGSELTIS